MLRNSLLNVASGLQENKKTFVTHVALSCIKSAFTNDTLLPIITGEILTILTAIITGEILRILTANNYR